MEQFPLISKLIGSSLLALSMLVVLYLVFSTSQSLFGKQILSYFAAALALLTLTSIGLLIVARRLNNFQLGLTDFLSPDKIISELVVSVIMVVSFLVTRIIIVYARSVFRRVIIYRLLHQSKNIQGEVSPGKLSRSIPVSVFLTPIQVVPIVSNEYIFFSRKKENIGIQLITIRLNDIEDKFSTQYIKKEAKKRENNVNENDSLLFDLLQIRPK